MLIELAELADDDERLLAGHAECLGMAAVYAGDLPRGTELLERALAGYRTAGDAQLVFDTLILLAGAYFFLDDRLGAAVTEEALALTERHQAPWSRGYALRAVALQHWRVGQHQEAANLLREAIGLRLPDRTLLALLLEALAWCRSSGGEHEQAARLLGCAHAVWRLSGARIGATGPFREIDERCAGQARARLGATAFDVAFTEGTGFGIDEAIHYALGDKPARPAPAPTRAGEPGGLTKREMEIAELVAQGMSNKAIAARLVIGRRTVETHVENILVKLSFTSRAQVASWLMEHKHQSP